MFSSFNNCRDEDAENQPAYRSTAETHTHIFSLIKSDHILFTELHTDKVVTSRKERKYSNDLIVRDVQLFVFTWLFRTNRNIHSKEH